MQSLDPTKKQDVRYVIPGWLRDEQVRLNIKLDNVGRIQGYPEGKTRNEPIAIVGFGPSLQYTWQKIKEFKYIITCSGAHPFLIEKGIVPTWHVAVDPLPKNTVRLIGQPHKDVEYLIASCCHPDVFAHLKDYNVKMWHVFSNEEEALRIIPHGEFLITGGSDAGMRSMTIARFMGFTNLHIFGLDGCADKNKSHAGDHPGLANKYQDCEYNGVMYKTTPALLECARQVVHELYQMPDVVPHFYGEGLTQEMVKKEYKPKKKKKKVPIAFNKEELISKEYIELNAQLHKDNLHYGVGGGKHAKTVLNLVKTLVREDNPFPSVLDYGAGKGYLQKELSFPIFQYDPAIPEISQSPRPADLVVCCDVLEHIEPDKIKAVLYDLHRVVKQLGYFVIHTGPAQKSYANGKNTHLIQRNKNWWEKQLSKYFVVGKIFEVGPELHAMVGKKNA